MMRIYIASSWKNQHAVELLTDQLRDRGCEVVSWVENNYGEDHGPDAGDFEKWVTSPAAMRAFEFDTQGAMTASLVVYIGPAGTDAWAEVGAAYGRGVPIIGLWAKGEPSGLMRHMMHGWCRRAPELLNEIEMLLKPKEGAGCFYSSSALASSYFPR